MASTECSGYRWNQENSIGENCNEESSTFFIILGFTMLVLVLLLFIIVVIACIRRARIRNRAHQSPPLATQENGGDWPVNIDGSGQTGEELNGRNMAAVKAVIMAGEEKPTFIAHPVEPRLPASHPSVEEGQEASPADPSKQVGFQT